MRAPGDPLRRMAEDEVARRSKIQSRQRALNPSLVSNSSRYSQETLSKALEMSSFRRTAVCFTVVQALDAVLDVYKAVVQTSGLQESRLHRRDDRLHHRGQTERENFGDQLGN